MQAHIGFPLLLLSVSVPMARAQPDQDLPNKLPSCAVWLVSYRHGERRRHGCGTDRERLHLPRTSQLDGVMKASGIHVPERLDGQYSTAANQRDQHPSRLAGLAIVRPKNDTATNLGTALMDFEER